MVILYDEAISNFGSGQYVSCIENCRSLFESFFKKLDTVNNDYIKGILNATGETIIENVETPKKANKAFVKGLKSVGRFIVEHLVESLEIAGLAIGGVAKAVSSIKGRGSGSTHSTPSTSANSSVAEKVADIVEKASRSLPSENDVTGHKQRYHTKNGVVWKDKAPYHRGGK